MTKKKFILFVAAYLIGVSFKCYANAESASAAKKEDELYRSQMPFILSDELPCILE